MRLAERFTYHRQTGGARLFLGWRRNPDGAGILVLASNQRAALDLHQVAIHTGQQHLAHLAPVSISLDPLNRHRLTGDHIGQALLGNIAECLPLFRCIDAGQPNLVLGVGVVQDCDAVAIGPISDFAQQGVGPHQKHQAKNQGSGR